MADINRNSRFWNEGPNPVPVNRLAEYFRHPLSDPFEGLNLPVGQASRLSTGITPVPLGLPVKAPHTPRPVRPPSESPPSFWDSYSGTTPARFGQRQPLTEEDTRIHAWLHERLALLHYERYGLWPRANRLLRAIARFILWPFVRKERFKTD
jgi:hypothetical protein